MDVSIDTLLELVSMRPIGSVSLAWLFALILLALMIRRSQLSEEICKLRPDLFEPEDNTKRLPILIVGAGPTGLTLASVLARYDVPIRIIEKKSALSKTTKAANLMQRSREYLFALGLHQQLEQVSGRMSRLMVQAYGKILGPRTMHLNESPFHEVLLCGQHNYERILGADLTLRGIKIEHSTALLSFKQLETCIVADLESDACVQQNSFSYVIGCDGWAGISRQFTNLDFSTTKTGVGIRQVDCKLQWNRLLDPMQMWLFYFDRGFGAVIPLPASTWRILFVQPKKDIPERDPSLAEMQAMLRQVTGDPSVTLTIPQWYSYTDLSMGIGPGMIDGRAILAGDASNPILPNGGQGMNTGIGDAFNLGWKLAAVYKHGAPKALLYTYEQERHALRSALQSAQYNSLKYTTLYTPAIMQMAFRWFADPVLNAGGEYLMAKAFSELNINTKRSALSIDSMRHTSGVKAGDRALDASVVHRSAAIDIYSLVYQGSWTLLAFTGRSRDETTSTMLGKSLLLLHRPDLRAFIVSTNSALDSTSEILYDLDEVAHRIYHVQRPTIYLIRPDGHIAVRTEPSQIICLRQFLAKWIPDASQVFSK